MRFLGRTYGYYPEDVELSYKVDSFNDGLSDTLNTLARSLNETDEEKRKAAQIEMATVVIPKFLAIVEKRLSENSSHLHIAGDSLTTADFNFAALLFSAFYNEANEKSAILQQIIGNFPKTKVYAENLRDVVLKEYLAQRPLRPY